MIKSLMTVGLLASSLFAAHAAEKTPEDIAAQTRFCEQRLTYSNNVQEILKSVDNQLYFTNAGGLMNGGVCWWHSRYTRNAAYLAKFRPDLAPPTTEQEYKKIVAEIRKGNRVVTVPGFKNLREFSISAYAQIQHKLEDWQKADGIMRFQWVAGLSGSSEVKDPAQLTKKMNELFERVSTGEVVYQKLQMPGIVSHAWLVVGMTKTADGYQLDVLDSNYVGTRKITFREGMTSFYDYNYGEFVPYTGKHKEEAKLRRAVNKECKEFLAAREALATVVEN